MLCTSPGNTGTPISLGSAPLRGLHRLRTLLRYTCYTWQGQYRQGSRFSLNLVNIKRIQVDYGPRGTRFGRNATGELVQVTTLD
jgi:hypothetical protein